MKTHLIQLDILNCTIRTCIAMYESTKDEKYIKAAKIAGDKFNRILAAADPDCDLTVMRVQ